MTDEHEDPAGDAGEEVVEDSAGEGVDRSEDRVDEPADDGATEDSGEEVVEDSDAEAAEDDLPAEPAEPVGPSDRRRSKLRLDPVGRAPRVRWKRDALSFVALAAMGLALSFAVFGIDDRSSHDGHVEVDGDASTDLADGSEREPSTTVTTTTAAPTTTTEAPEPIDSEEPGLGCSQLIARGYEFGDAFRYFQRTGRPERMDPEGNGIPCDKSYPAEEVEAILRWFDEMGPPSTTTTTSVARSTTTVPRTTTTRP